MLDFGFDLDDSVELNTVVEKPSVISILSQIKSGIALDISKRSTGVCIWYDNQLEIYSIHLQADRDIKSNALAEEEMRREFRKRLQEIIKDRNFEYGAVENVFGGENFDTVRKLLALNTVLDGMILDGVVKIQNYYKMSNKEWKRYFRSIYKLGGAPTDKYEIQEIMRYLEYPFFLEHENDSEKEKEELGFQDILDATGILVSLSLREKTELGTTKPRHLSISKINMKFFDCEEDFEYNNRSRKLQDAEITMLGEYTQRDIEKYIVSRVEEDASKVYMLEVDNNNLGYFGLKHNVAQSPYGSVYIIFYAKALKL